VIDAIFRTSRKRVTIRLTLEQAAEKRWKLDRSAESGAATRN